MDTLLGRALWLRTERVGRLSTAAFITTDSSDVDELSPGIISVGEIFPSFACSWILLNFDPMIGSSGVIMIAPNMTQSAPDILPAVIRSI